MLFVLRSELYYVIKGNNTTELNETKYKVWINNQKNSKEYIKEFQRRQSHACQSCLIAVSSYAGDKYCKTVGQMQ